MIIITLRFADWTFTLSVGTEFGDARRSAGSSPRVSKRRLRLHAVHGEDQAPAACARRIFTWWPSGPTWPRRRGCAAGEIPTGPPKLCEPGCLIPKWAAWHPPALLGAL